MPQVWFLKHVFVYYGGIETRSMSPRKRDRSANSPPEDRKAKKAKAATVSSTLPKSPTAFTHSDYPNDPVGLRFFSTDCITVVVVFERHGLVVLSALASKYQYL